MKFKILKYILITIAALFLLPAIVLAKNNDTKGKRTLAKTTAGQIGTAALNINNINSLQSNTGYSDYNPDSNKEGTEFPKGTAKNAIFESGFLWGGYPNGNTTQVYVGGSAYRSGLQPGPIMSDGQPADPSDPRWSIYRVRPDVYPDGPSVDLSSDAASESYWDPANPVSADQVKAQYESDWTNWPAAGTSNDLGAPFTDKNNDGIYEPDVDIPGVPGADQTIFYVANDENSDNTTSLYGAQPLGIEVHVTMWAYAQQGALGNMYFKKFEIINKGYQKYAIDSMFVSWWADVDLGSSSDDLVGNDSTLSLTYVYNGQPSDATYAPLPPPAVGADFFQGPVVDGSPSDFAIFHGKVVYGKKNLPMTAAYTFTNPGSGYDANYNDPDQGLSSGSTQFYNFFNGENRVGTPFVDPNTNKVTKVIFPGDPVSQSGWVDGITFSPRDVRSGMASGPFTMAPGDTQEVVVAEVVAGAVPSVNYLQAISLLKVYDKTAQNAYDHFFNLPSAPPPPQAAAVPLNKKVVIDWGENMDKVNATENTVVHDVIDSVDTSGGGDYKFEGYNVYQLPYFGASKEQAQLVATFDVVNDVSTIPYTDPVTRTVEPSIIIQNGTDSGIKRYFVDSVDVFNGNKALNNGTPYYFAVTAYSYNPKGVPQSLENPISILTVTPQSTSPGVTRSDAIDTLKVTHTAGNSDGIILPIVIDPTRIKNENYKVTFTEDKDTNSATYGQIVWNLQNSAGTFLYSKRPQYLPSDYTSDTQILDGIQLVVAGPPLQGLSFSSTGNRWLSGNSANGGELMFGAAFLGPTFLGSSVAPPDYKSVRVDVYKPESYTDVNGNGKYDVGEPYVVNPDSGQVANLYTTWGTGNWEKTALVPFKVYDISTDPPRQLDVIVRDRDGNGQWDPDDGNIQFNYVFVMNTTYDPTGKNWNPTDGGQDFMEHALDGTEPIQWMFWWTPRGTTEQMSASFSMTFIAPKVNTTSDVFTFNSTAQTYSNNLAKTDVNKINVFPNPYYGVNYLETSKYSRFITFSHLPDDATIRIFNLAGIQVKMINHTNGQFEKWDLTNESQLPVASGLYLAYIDMPKVGATKILKFTIIQEQQIPDHF